VFPWRLIIDSRRFETLYQFHLLRQFDVVCIELPKKMEPIENSETSAINNPTPEKHPKENIPIDCLSATNRGKDLQEFLFKL
jgi:hypothetical protein